MTAEADVVDRGVAAVIPAVELGDGGGEAGEVELVLVDLALDQNHLALELCQGGVRKTLRVDHEKILQTDVLDVNSQFTNLRQFLPTCPGHRTPPPPPTPPSPSSPYEKSERSTTAR